MIDKREDFFLILFPSIFIQERASFDRYSITYKSYQEDFSLIQLKRKQNKNIKSVTILRSSTSADDVKSSLSSQ